MVEFVKLSCPSCGGKLEITNDINQFACAHCGNEHRVVRSGGLISLNPVEEDIAKIEKNTDLTASELAIKRLKQEIRELEKNLHSILYPLPKPGQSILGRLKSEIEHFGTPKPEEVPWWFFITYESYSGKKYKNFRETLDNLPIEELKAAVAFIEKSKLAPENMQAQLSFGNKLIAVKQDIERKQALLAKHQKRVDSIS